MTVRVTCVVVYFLADIRRNGYNISTATDVLDAFVTVIFVKPASVSAAWASVSDSLGHCRDGNS